MNMIISVTEEDIALGKKGRYRGCPVALAATRATGHEVGVTHDTIDIQMEDERIEIITPAEAKSFIRRFDHGKPVKPFTFTLSIP